MNAFFTVVLLLLLFPACSRQITGGEEQPDGIIRCEAINEASGLVASRLSPTVLWTHNDSGDQARIFAINPAGETLGVFYFAGIEARDWEDIAAGPGPEPGTTYLYVGDIGDNKARYEEIFIHRVAEPVPGTRDNPVQDSLSVATLTLRYPDGARDAEALLVDPLSRSLVIISKREERVRIYSTALDFKQGEVRKLEFRGTLPLSQITAGDISTAGDRVLLKNYFTIFSWQRTHDSLDGLFAQPPDTLNYRIEPQGEALCIDYEGKGYFTLSEERNKIPARLYYYPF